MKDPEIESVFSKSYPTYQYSVFTKNGRDEQLVIRADTFTELIEAKQNINRILAKQEQADPEPTTQTNLPMCTIHNKIMKERTSPEGTVFYSHAFKTKEGNWLYCSGKGFTK